MDSSLLWTPKKNPRSVTFFNSVTKTSLLQTLLTDIRQLRTLFFVPIEENPSITDKKYPFQRKNIIFWQSCQMVLSWSVKQIVEKTQQN